MTSHMIWKCNGCLVHSLAFICLFPFSCHGDRGRGVDDGGVIDLLVEEGILCRVGPD